MQGTQDCIARRLCKYNFSEVTGSFKVSPYIIGGKLLSRPDLMRCHISSLKIIYESQCAMNLRVTRNVRPNTTSEKKSRFYCLSTNIHIFAYLFIVAFFYSTLFSENWRPLYCYIHPGLLQATILPSISAKLYLTEARSRCQLTLWSQLVINFV